MAVEKDLEKAAGTVEVVSGEARGNVEEIRSIGPVTNAKTVPVTGGGSSPTDIDPTPTDPENAAKLQIDRSVAEIAKAMREGTRARGNLDQAETASRIVESIYERNLDVCTAVLVKDYMRSREHPSIERWEVVRASVRKHGKCKNGPKSIVL